MLFAQTFTPLPAGVVAIRAPWKNQEAMLPCKHEAGAHDVFSQHRVGCMDLGAHGARHLAVDQTVRVPGRAAHLARGVMRQQLRARANASRQGLPAWHAPP